MRGRKGAISMKRCKNCYYRRELFGDVYKRQTYDNILRLVDIPDVREPIKFLRQREVTHFQRFGEALRMIQDDLDCKNFYAFNPNFDNPSK